MNRVVMFSGGKDSACLVHVMLSRGYDITVVFCNTGWELPETLKYIKQFNAMYLNGELIELKSKEYDGLEDLIIKKNYMPTVHQRFCTEELKIKPIQNYIVGLEGETHLYNGVRAEESYKRRYMEEHVFDDNFDCWIHRPLLAWTADHVFEFLTKNNIIINPLYKKGMKRVGCGPCIMISLKEFAVLKETHPERIKQMRELEKKTKQQFFKSNFIPERFRNAVSSKGNKRASVDDIIRYLDSKPKYYELSEQAGHSCMSYYNLCE